MRLLEQGGPITGLSSVFVCLFSAPLADVRRELGVGIQNFLLVVRTAFIKNHMANHNQKLLALPGEAARERMLTGHIHQPFSHPLPELLLSGPEVVVIGTNYSCGFLHFT